MNKFYKINIVIQWFIGVFMFFLMIFVLNLWIKLINEYLVAVILVFIIVSIIQFLVTPLFKLIGLYTYLSPMLVVFAANKRRYDLHNGSSFDYLMVMSKIKSGVPYREKMLEYYIDGLLTIINHIENKKISKTVLIRGSSYFFSPRTVERLGFKLSKTSIPERINILLNYLDLLWMYSFAHNKLVFPRLRNIRTVAISGKQLLEKKPTLLELNAFLGRDRAI